MDFIINSLQQKINALEVDPTMTLTLMVQKLRDDLDINWNAIRDNEKSDTLQWASISANWKTHVIGRMCSNGRFKRGGDRCSVKARGAKQQEIVEFVEKKTSEAPVDEDDDAVADQCLDAVERRWKVADPNGLSVMRTVVRTVSHSCVCCIRIQKHRDMKAKHSQVSTGRIGQ